MYREKVVEFYGKELVTVPLPVPAENARQVGVWSGYRVGH
jgi:hypothetical protein